MKISELQRTRQRPPLRLEARYTRHADLKGFIDHAYEDKLAKTISEELWLEKTRQWESERAQVRAEMAALEDKTDEYMNRGGQLIELMQHAEIIFKNATPEKKRKMVELVSSNLLLANGNLEYHWKKPFNVLAVKGDLENWRAQAAQYRTWFIQNPAMDVNVFNLLRVA